MRSFKSFLVLGLMVLLIGFTFNCKWLKNPFGSDTDNGEDSGGCQRPLEPPTGNIGNIIQSCHFELEFEWAERTDYYKMLEPKDEENNILIVFLVRVKLLKFNEIAPLVWGNCFWITDNQGNQYSYEGLGKSGEMMEQTALNEGEEVEGTVIMEVPKTSSGLIVLFQALETSAYGDKIKCNLGF